LDTGRTGKESAADGLAKYLEERSQLKARPPLPRPFSLSELSICNGMPFPSGERGFDLAADFLYSIVVSVDFMTFQMRDIVSASEKLVDARHSGTSMPFTSFGWCRYRHGVFLAPETIM
jgi:hypothetical protein